MTSYKFLILFLLMTTLSSCQKESNYTYLVEHPLELQKEVEACRAANLSNTTQLEHCKIVGQATSTIIQVIREQEQDPEKFGEKVLTMQTACAKAKKEMEALQMTLAAFKKIQPQEKEVEKIRQKLVIAKNNYEAQAKQIKIYLAVLSLNSPE